jgi:hypothetical protein
MMQERSKTLREIAFVTSTQKETSCLVVAPLSRAKAYLNKVKRFTGLAALALGAAGTAHAANIVVNGNFENYSLVAWSNTSPNPWGADFPPPPLGGGTKVAATGCVDIAACTLIGGPGRSELSQLLPTVAGFFTLQFDFLSIGGTPNELNVLWSGASVLDLINLASTGNSPGTGVFQHYTVTGLVGLSGGTMLSFLGSSSPGVVLLDNVSVDLTSGGTVPVPETWTMLLLGFGALAFAMRSKSHGMRLSV